MVSEHSAAESTKKKHPATVHSPSGDTETVSSEHQSSSNHAGADDLKVMVTTSLYYKVQKALTCKPELDVLGPIYQVIGKEEALPFQRVLLS